jgi:hypothetical protein
MSKELNSDELQTREDKLFIKLINRKCALDVAGVPPTHDKLFCLWKWQFDQIEAAKASLLEDAT